MFFHSSACQYTETLFSINSVCLCHLCLFLCVLLTYAFMLIYERVNAHIVYRCVEVRNSSWVFPSYWFSHYFLRHCLFFPESAPHWFTIWWLPWQRAPETLLFPSPEHQEFRSKPCGASGRGLGVFHWRLKLILQESILFYFYNQLLFVR